MSQNHNHEAHEMAQLDEHIRQRKATGDELLDIMLQTRPRSNAARASALEERLIAQLQHQRITTERAERQNPMQLTSLYPNEMALPARRPIRLPLTLVATIALVLIGITLLSPLLRPPSGGSNASGLIQQNPTEEPTVPRPTIIPTSTPFGVNQTQPISTIVAPTQMEIPVYTATNSDSEQLGILIIDTRKPFISLGTDASTQWIAVEWQHSIDGITIIGWVSALDVMQAYAEAPAAEPIQAIEVTATPIPFSNTEVITATPIPFSSRGNNNGASETTRIGHLLKDTVVYALPDADSEALGKLSTDQPVEIIGHDRSGQWLVIRWEGMVVGWVETTALGSIPEPEAPPAMIASVVPTVVPPLATASPIPTAVP